MKFTNILCSIISIVFWIVGIYIGIKGVIDTAVPFILAAVISIPFTEASLSPIIKNRKTKRAIIIGKNSIILLVAGFLVVQLVSNNITPQKLWDIENPMALDSESATTECKEPAITTKKHLKEPSTSKDNSSKYDGSTPISDNLFRAIDKINKAIEEYSRKERKRLEEIVDKSRTPSDEEEPSSSSDDEPEPEPDSPEPEPEIENPENKITANGLEVHFLDVGQGDAALILCGNEAVLVDTGTDDNGTKIQNYLTKHGVKTLKALILTHPDADHIGSADVIITKFHIENVFMPDCKKDTKTYRDLINALTYKGYTSCMPEIDSSHTVGDATYTILAPGRNYEDTNNNSIVFKLEYGNNSFLFTGDAAHESEKDIIATGADISADVLKVGHHGSKYSSSEEFITAVSPIYALISCAEDNDYYHPHAAALNILRKAGVQLYRTDEQGTIVATSDGEKITFNCAPSDTWKSGSP